MSRQKLELTWIGKETRPKLEPRILLGDPERSYHAKHRVSDADIFDNQLIFGDNLLALKAVEQEYAGKVEFRRYLDNTDSLGNQLAQQFNVQYVPTFVFVNADGSVSGQPIVGGVDEATLRARLDVLKQAPAKKKK